MIKINLLTEKITPIRSRPRGTGEGRRNLVFGLIILAALAYVAFQWSLYRSKIAELDTQLTQAREEKDRLQRIHEQVDEYDRKKKELNQKIDIISELKKKQTGPVHLLDEVSKALPNRLWLNSLKQQKEGKVVLDGEAVTLPEVADFIQNLRASPYVANPELINSEERQGIIVFSMTFDFQQPEERVPEEG